MAIQYVDKKNNGTVASPTEITDSTANRQIIKNSPEAAGLAYDRATKTLKYNGSDEIRHVQSNYRRTLTPTAAYQLLVDDSGKTIFLNAAAGFAITLPTPAAGLNFRFVTAAAFATTPFTIGTSGAANIIYGVVDVNSTLVPASGEDSINFVESAELPGDWVEVESDGTNWYVRGQAATTGAITLTT